METCKFTRHRCNYAPFNPTSEECHACVLSKYHACVLSTCGYCDTDSVDANTSYTNILFDTRAIKPEKYAELREQDFDTWLDTILHEIIEQVNLDAREYAYIQCIRASNQLDTHNAKLGFLDDRIDALKDLFKDLETQINDLSIRFDEFKKFVGYTLANPAVSHHTGSNFCGNCTHCSHVAPNVAYRCKLSGEIVDPDDSSCAMFEYPF